MLALLRDRLGDEVTIEIVLNPVDNLSKLPLTSYYRYVVPTMSAEEAPKAIITNVPTHKTLTMHVDFPEAWMVTTHKASYDLDNLILKDISERIVRAEYRLESLLVTGHATDGAREPREGRSWCSKIRARPRAPSSCPTWGISSFRHRRA